MIFFISEKGGYDNFLKTHNDWIMSGLENDVRDTQKSEDYKAFTKAAIEGNKINDVANELGVNAGVDPDKSFRDVDGNWADIVVKTQDLVNKLNKKD